MTKLILNTLIVSMLLLFASAGDARTTSKPSAIKQSCSQYYSDFAPLLPAKHPTEAGKDFNSCTEHHIPNSQINIEERF